MAGRNNLGTLTADLALNTGKFTEGMSQAERAAKKLADTTARQAAALERENTKFLASLKEQADAIGKTRAEILEMQAAQKGLASAAAPYIAKLKEQEQALKSTGAQLNAYGMSSKQTAAALRGLPAQFTDIAVSLQAGQRPLTVLLQQGGQLKDMFGGIGPAVRAMGGYLLSLINPLTVTAAGFAALAAAMASVESKQREYTAIRTQFSATGRNVDTQWIDNLIFSINRLPGVTRDAATQTVAEFSKIQGLGTGILVPLSKIVADFAAATGTEVPAAAKRLAQAFADPKKGAEELDRQLNFLTADQYLTIQSMAEMGDKAGAQKMLFDALASSTRGLANEGTELQKATKQFGSAWDDAMRSLSANGPLKDANSLLAFLVVKAAQAVEWLGKIKIPKVVGDLLLGGGIPVVGALVGAGGRGAEPRVTHKEVSGRIGSLPQEQDTQTQQTELKGILERTSAYGGEAKQIRTLTNDIKQMKAALADLNKSGQGSSASAKQLTENLKGAEKALADIRKRQAGPKGKAFTDDASTRLIASLKEAEASLKLQLATDEKLTNSEKERAKFVQQIADLKDKKQLTAEQKSLLAAKDQILAQLDINVGLERQIVAKEKQKKLDEEAAQRAKDFRNQIEAITASMEAANQNRSEQYDSMISAFGLGDRASQQVQAATNIMREFQRFREQLNRAAAKGDFLGAASYEEALGRIESAQQRAIDLMKNYYAQEEQARSNWLNGANKALDNYIDRVNDAAARANEAITQGLDDITEGITGLITGDRAQSLKDFGKKFVDQITKGIVEQQITKPLAQWLKGQLSDPESGLGNFLGGLLGGNKDGSTFLGDLLGVKPSAPGAAAQRGGSMANPLFVKSVDGGLLGAATGGGGSGNGWLSSLVGGFGGIFGGFSNSVASSLANALPGDSLDNLFRLSNNFGGFRAAGGPVLPHSLYRVNERAPELLTAANGDQFLLNGTQAGHVSPSGPGGQTLNVNIQGFVKRDTPNQIAMEVRRQSNIASARFR